MSRSRRLAIALVGVVCFAIGALYFAAHPDHEWWEITGEPETVPIQVDGDGSVATTVFE